MHGTLPRSRFPRVQDFGCVLHVQARYMGVSLNDQTWRKFKRDACMNLNIIIQKDPYFRLNHNNTKAPAYSSDP